MSKIRVEIRSEERTSYEPACVTIYEGDQIVAQIFATVELKEGADGGFYHCVTLKKQEQSSSVTA